MAKQAVIGAADGPRLTVSQLLKDPTTIPRRMIKMLDQQFITDAVLRKLPPTQSGAYVYEESTPLFADGTSEVVAEFGEIPVVSGSLGAQKVTTTVKRALGIQISLEMKNRNNIDRVGTLMTQVKNTLVRDHEDAFLKAVLANSSIPSVAATAAWSNSGMKIRTDLTAANATIEGAAPTETPGDYYGFSGDTLLIGLTTKNNLLLSDDFNKAMDSAGALAAENTNYTGTLPKKFTAYTVIVSRRMDLIAPGKALLIQKGVLGGIGDERPTWSTPMDYDPRRETYYSFTGRQSAIVIDQPKSACWITGV